MGADLSVRAHAHSPSWDHLGRHTHMRTHMCKCHFVGAPTCAPTWAHVLPFFALGLKASENLAKTITNATLGPHAPEVGSKMRQVGPKMLQDRPKMAPRGLQMAPRPLQEPKMSPRCPKIVPKRPQHGAPEHGKRCSRLGAVQFLRNWPISVLPFAFLFSPVFSQPNLASRWPEDGPKMPQDGSKMAPGKLKIAPRWPRQTPGWPKKGPRRHGQTPR